MTSKPDGGFLARWSRRKRRQDNPPTNDSPEVDDQISEQSAQQSESPESGAVRQDPEPLPRIEDLTAESDLSAFLRAGVPQELQKAALRRAWSLDPAIRDYCGPADYALDFNNPDALPGFASNQALELARKVLNELAEAEQVPQGDEPSSAQLSPADKIEEG
jgi:Protein of unknown function (DUF3306)